jgi:hypothetical protein
MDAVSAIALTLGASWASGVNLYAAILALGLMHDTGHVVLPPELAVLGDPLVLVAAGIMYAVEFVADKVPGVDTGWDALHTFIRIPAGAILAYQAAAPVDPALALAAGLLGGTLAGTSHAVKASSRMLINTSPEPFSNWTASVAEDVAVIGGLWTAVNHPALFLVLLAGFVALAIWLVPKILRLLGRVAGKIAAFFGGSKGSSQPAPEAEAPQAPQPLRVHRAEATPRS